MKPHCDLHNPGRVSRILIVAGVFAVPGALAGALMAVFTGGLGICLIAGIVIATAIGAVVEAWPLASKSRFGVTVIRDGKPVTEIHLKQPIHQLSDPKFQRRA